MNKLFFCIISMVWCGVMVVNFATKNVQFSESENRFLEKMPTYSLSSLVDGSYMNSIDSYLNDHFVGRDGWITAKSNLEYASGKRENNNIFIGKDMLLSHIAKKDDDIIQRNINGINAFSNAFEKPVYVMLVPSASAVLPQKLPAFAPVWNENEMIDQTYLQLSATIKPISVMQTLRDHSGEYIYYRTDHHWTTYGALLASQIAREVMSLPAKTQKDYTASSLTEEFYGTLYSRSGVRGITADSISSFTIGKTTSLISGFGENAVQSDDIFFPNFLAQKDKYSYFLGINQPINQINTTSKSGKKLLLFKDSYAHCFVPMLLEDYSEITLVDLRYLPTKLDEVLSLAHYDQALFLYSVDVFSHQKDLGTLSLL